MRGGKRTGAGRPSKAPEERLQTVAVTVRLPLSAKGRLEALSELLGLSQGETVTEALAELDRAMSRRAVPG